MSEASKIIPLKKGEQPDNKMLVTITVAELRAIIRQEIHATGRNDLKADEWVDIETAAKLMAVSVEWIYHNARSLPFASKIGRRLLRFSRNGLQKWMESRKA
jgi:predicted DNA-binding transcriptional regulator AlpA